MWLSSFSAVGLLPSMQPPYQQLTANPLALAIPAHRAVRIHSRCKQPGLRQCIPAVLSLT